MWQISLTDEQAETLGYALTIALRTERQRRIGSRIGAEINPEMADRIRRIEELRQILDNAPISA